MAQCISFDEARKRRELGGHPLRRRTVSKPRQKSEHGPLAAGAKPPIRFSRPFGWAAVLGASSGLGGMLFSLLFGRKPGSPHAPASGAGPLAS